MILKQFDSKERSILLVALLGCIALLYLLFDDSLLTDSFGDDDSQLIGKLSFASGDVRHKNNKDFQWKTAKQDRSLHWGDGVFTGGNSKAHVDLLNGGHLELDQNSLVILTPTQEDLTLELKFGQFKGDLKGQGLKVRVGNEVLTVAGSDAGVDSQVEFGRDANQNLLINVVKGSVDVSGGKSGSRKIVSGRNAKISSDGTEVDETASKGSILRKTATTGETTPIDKPIKKRARWKNDQVVSAQPVQLDENGVPIEKPKLDLNWVPTDANGQTIVEVSTDPNFNTIILSKTTDGNSLQTEIEKPGVYYARVKPASDPDAPWSTTQKIVVEGKVLPPIEAPLLANSSLVIDPEQTNKTRLEWTAPERAQKYKVEYSKDPEFKTVTGTVETSNPSSEFVATQPGKTYYRIRGVSANGKEGDVSAVGEISVANRALVVGSIENKEIFGKTPKAPPETIDVRVAWNQLKTAPLYEVQLAKDEQFKAGLKKFVTPSNSGALKVSEPGDYHVRIRPLTADKKPIGRFSEPQKFNYTYKVPLAQPILVEPMANSTMFFQTSEGPFWFIWKKVRQAEKYDLEIATDPEFNNKVISKQTDSNRYLFDGKTPPGQLYWRVRATNPERMSHWSETRNLKIFSGRRAFEGEE